MGKVRTTVVLPAETAARLRECVPARKRSEFVAEAVDHHLMALAFELEREGTFGAWGDESHGDLKTAEDMRRHMADLRDDSTWRSVAPQQS